MTSDLVKRIWQHRNDEADGFTKKCGAHILVWFEQHENAESAITREKQIKKWNRMWKILEIEVLNPTWKDLYDDVTV